MNPKTAYLKGAAILAVSFFLAIWLMKPAGVSTQFSVMSGMVHSFFDKDLITQNTDAENGYESTNAYYNKDGGKIASEIEHPIQYGMVFVFAIPLGAFLGYLSDRGKQSKDQIEEEHETPGTSQKKRYIIAFIGGFILLFGARMAGGCTSGHMMSGMMQGSVSGYAFAASAFLTAIPSAILMHKRERRK